MDAGFWQGVTNVLDYITDGFSDPAEQYGAGKALRMIFATMTPEAQRELDIRWRYASARSRLRETTRIIAEYESRDTLDDFDQRWLDDYRAELPRRQREYDAVVAECAEYGIATDADDEQRHEQSWLSWVR